MGGRVGAGPRPPSVTPEARGPRGLHGHSSRRLTSGSSKPGWRSVTTPFIVTSSHACDAVAINRVLRSVWNHPPNPKGPAFSEPAATARVREPRAARARTRGPALRPGSHRRGATREAGAGPTREAGAGPDALRAGDARSVWPRAANRAGQGAAERRGGFGVWDRGSAGNDGSG